MELINKIAAGLGLGLQRGGEAYMSLLAFAWSDGTGVGVQVAETMGSFAEPWR